MRRRLYVWGLIVAVVIGLGLTFVATRSSKANNGNAKDKKQVEVKIRAWGPDQATIDEASRFATAHADVQHYLSGTRYRLISFKLIDDEIKGSAERLPPNRFLATYYDYTNNRAVMAEGRLDRTSPLTVTESNYQMRPSDEEFQAAVEILRNDSRFASTLRNNKLITDRPMPPVLYPANENDRVQRTIFVGLTSPDGKDYSEIVGVNMITGRVIRYATKAPRTSYVAPESCGYPSAGGSISPGAQSYEVSIMQGQTELWRFIVTRPAASSGSDGSGIEFTDVRYKGKMMLKRMNIPVLNVKYVSSCGPYRDWQNQESSFVIDPTSPPEVAPGIRFSNTPATTIVETHNDAGNFGGVAIYTQDNETVLVTEMAAGWYRYLNEYRFSNDGTIHPRYGYGSTSISCVCIQRVHHSYWRFDFDVNGPNNTVYELNRGVKWQTLKAVEYTQLRNPQTLRRWLITNPTTGESVMLSPNPDGKDGTASLGGQTAFAQSDFWLLRYKPFPTELNDTSGNYPGIDLSSYFSTPEDTVNQDIVIWYGTHVQRQDDTSRMTTNQRLNGFYSPGPEIRAINW
jgi:hypothetical protein